MRALEFKPDCGFFELRAVKLTILITSIISAFLMILIYINSGTPEGCLHYECVNHFITIYKFPLAILALLIPILAVYATNHRSIQSKANAEIAKSQNTFVNYYKHLDEFEKYGQDLKTNNYIVDFRRMHKKVYPNAHCGDFSVSERFLSSVSGLLDQCLSEARLFTSNDSSTFNQAEELIIFRLEEFLYNYNECITYSSELSEDVKIMRSFGGDRNYLRSLKEAVNIAEVFHLIWCFDTNYNRALLQNIKVMRRVLSWQKGLWGDKNRKPIPIVKTLIANGYIFSSETTKQRAETDLSEGSQ